MPALKVEQVREMTFEDKPLETELKFDSQSNLTGFPSTLTAAQRNELNDLKAKLKEHPEYEEKFLKQADGDEFLLRILRATMKHKNSTRDFNSDEALKRLINILDFKSKYEVNKRPSEFTEFKKVYPHVQYQDFKANRLVYISRLGEFCSNAKFSHFSEDTWSKCIGHGTELVEESMRGIPVENRGYVVISDMSGIKLSVLARKKATTFLTNVAGQNYPEVMEKVYLVNVPWIFEKVYAVIKPMLDPHTTSKFEMHSNVPVDLFRKMFDVSKLPKEYGGESDVVVPFPKDSKKFDEKLVSIF